jgi:hypothetical protein
VQVEALTARPDPPEDFGEVERAVWNLVLDALPSGLASPLDLPTVERLARLSALRSTLDRVVKLRPFSVVPVQSPRGGQFIDHDGNPVTRIEPNPMLRELLLVDRQLDVLSAALAMSPQSRARLGLTVAQTAQVAAEAETLLERLARPAAERVDIEIIED